MTGPWTFDQAHDRCVTTAQNQEEAEQRLREAWHEFAEAEGTYRRALTTRALQYKAEGFAITTCEGMARGNDDIAALREARDMAEGARESAQSALWRHNANRKDSRGFAEWSQRREIAEGYGDGPDVDWSKQPVDGAGVPAGVDPATGELRSAA